MSSQVSSKSDHSTQTVLCLLVCVATVPARHVRERDPSCRGDGKGRPQAASDGARRSPDAGIGVHRPSDQRCRPRPNRRGGPRARWSGDREGSGGPGCHVLLGIEIDPIRKLTVVPSSAATESLTKNGWSTFLVKVHNSAAVTERVDVDSPEAAIPYDFSRMQVERSVYDDQFTDVMLEKHFHVGTTWGTWGGGYPYKEPPQPEQGDVWPPHGDLVLRAHEGPLDGSEPLPGSDARQESDWLAAGVPRPADLQPGRRTPFDDDLLQHRRLAIERNRVGALHPSQSGFPRRGQAELHGPEGGSGHPEHLG